ncbi:hypothetical protein [Cellvibrio sp. PSBB023]|uniref:hypothetical protein n=1 Tax=Cellvibrio sp. PSBB023 TaxID=1945512 RepID=UPI00098F310C|nr:hypothetical protein [Cellvibrio sp. PSBB023]AQT61244.1 hypothetical protein B0D95_14880 [Cellvibrio sp. PSBB023]
MNIENFLGTTVLVAVTSAAHGAQTWTVTVPDSSTAKLECPDTSKLDTCLLPTGKTNSFADGAAVKINCSDANVCKDVRIFTEAGGKPIRELKGAADASATSRIYTLSTKDITEATNVGAFHQKALLTSFTLQPSADTTIAGGKVAAAGGVSLETVVAGSNPMPFFECPSQLQPIYSKPNDVGEAVANATIYTDVLGNVLAKPSYSFDENDSLTVYVLGDKDLLQRLKVARTSDIRDLTKIRIIGEDVEVPGLGKQHAQGEEITCAMRKFEIDSFAPGKGVVAISRVKGEEVSAISTFDLNVARLYSGMFTLGAFRTDLVDPKYKLVSNGSDQVIAPENSSDTDTRYSIFYTPFIWGRRDLEKPFEWSSWYQHINPTLGFVLDDVSDNFLAGVSIDLPRGVVVTVGKHYGKVTQLSKESGLSTGSVFTGAADTIPTSESWESDNFVAVSFDIGVTVKLIKSAFTTTTGK